MVSQETASAHSFTLANVRLAYAPTGCSPTQETGSFALFQFPLTHCGTTVQVGAAAGAGAQDHPWEGLTQLSPPTGGWQPAHL